MRFCYHFSLALLTAFLFVSVGCTDSKDAQTANGNTNGDVPSISVPSAGQDDGNLTCIGTKPTRTTEEPTAGETVANPTQPGSAKPTWTLKDLQPQSCGANQIYGLDALDGKPLMVVLLWGGCGFCQAQAEKLQQLHYELRAEGVQVNFAIVNMARGSTSLPEKFAERTYFPIFQDTPEVDAWGLMEGKKDDFYFYRSDGILHKHLSITGDVDLVLSSNMPGVTAEGYTNLKNVILELVMSDAGPTQPAGGGTAAGGSEGSGGQSDIGGEPIVGGQSAIGGSSAGDNQPNQGGEASGGTIAAIDMAGAPTAGAGGQ